MAVTVDKLELVDAWSDALDFKVDAHLQLIQTKDPVKRKLLTNVYNKADRVCKILQEKLCQN